MKAAEHPFRFVTASYLTRINNLKASNLDELSVGLEKTSDDSIFFHTFNSLGRYHFLNERFSNDFAHWVLTGLNCRSLAQQLAALDMRDYSSIAPLRKELHHLVTGYCHANPHEAKQPAFEAFYFCESIVAAEPHYRQATTLGEFRDSLSGLAHESFYYHFIGSRLRLPPGTNDFSHWFDCELDLKDLAQRTDRIDIYSNTLETAQAAILGLVDRELKFAKRNR